MDTASSSIEAIIVYNAQHASLAQAWADGFTPSTGIKVILRNGSATELGNQLVSWTLFQRDRGRPGEAHKSWVTPHDVTHPDVNRLFEQAQPAAAPTRGVEQQLARQIVGDLHQVVLQPAVVYGQRRDGDMASGCAAQYINTRRVWSVSSDNHRWMPEDTSMGLLCVHRGIKMH